MTRNGRTLVTFLVDTMSDATQKPRDRIECCKLLFERGWGRPQPTTTDPLLQSESEPLLVEARRAWEAIIESAPATPRVYNE